MSVVYILSIKKNKEKIMSRSSHEEAFILSNNLEQRLYNRRIAELQFTQFSTKTLERLFPTQLLATRLNKIENHLNPMVVCYFIFL